KGMQIPGRETVMKIAYDTKKPYYTRSLDQIISNSSPYLITQGIQSAVSIPIISEDICIGTLNLGSMKEDGFDNEQIDLLATFARGKSMRTRMDDPDIIRGLDIIEKAAIDGASTVRRLQDFTRKRTDQVFGHVDLIQVIEDTLSMTRTRWEDSAHVSGIQYSITTQYEPILPVAGDTSELREVFT